MQISPFAWSPLQVIFVILISLKSNGLDCSSLKLHLVAVSCYHLGVDGKLAFSHLFKMF